jgi:hypothetical protein
LSVVFWTVSAPYHQHFPHITVQNNLISSCTVFGSPPGLGYRDLQKQCSQHGLDTGGNSKQLKERLLEYLVEETQSETQPTSETEAVTTSDSDTAAPAAAPAASTPGSKTGEAIAKEMLCPITHELPFDPVMAGTYLPHFVVVRSVIAHFFALLNVTHTHTHTQRTERCTNTPPFKSILTTIQTI